MKILMCPNCFELYNALYLKENKENKFYCPKPNCLNRLVEIDENIAPVIRLLNLKGYETLYCCGGHPLLEESVYPYIFFKCYTIPSILPEGWEWDKTGKQCTITFDVSKINYWEGIKNLYKWVEELPKYKEEKNNDDNN